MNASIEVLGSDLTYSFDGQDVGLSGDRIMVIKLYCKKHCQVVLNLFFDLIK